MAANQRTENAATVALDGQANVVFHPSAAQRAPAEILDQIFSTLCSYNLQKCNRICHSWAYAANPHVFKSLGLGRKHSTYPSGTPMSVENALKFLAQSRYLARYTRQLSFDDAVLDLELDDLYKILGILPHVHTLDLNVRSIVGRHLAPSPLPLLSTLSHLSLVTVIASKQGIITRLFSFFLSINDLVINSPGFSQQIPDGGSLLPSKLKVSRLTFEWPTAEGLSYLESILDFSCVTFFREWLGRFPQHRQTKLRKPYSYLPFSNLTEFHMMFYDSTFQYKEGLNSLKALRSLHVGLSVSVVRVYSRNIIAVSAEWRSLMNGLRDIPSSLKALHFTLFFRLQAHLGPAIVQIDIPLNWKPIGELLDTHLGIIEVQIVIDKTEISSRGMLTHRSWPLMVGGFDTLRARVVAMTNSIPSCCSCARPDWRDIFHITHK